MILASASPRRRQILSQMGLDFTVAEPRVDERVPPGLSARDTALQLARQKAWAVKAPMPALILGADTVVVCRGRILGKPRDRKEARAMLSLLAGGSHSVVTGLCLRYERMCWQHAQTSRVTLDPIEAEEIDRYVKTPEPYDKAGGYAIQGWAGQYISRIEGCFYNIVGLPMAALRRLLCQAERDLTAMGRWGGNGSGTQHSH